MQDRPSQRPTFRIHRDGSSPSSEAADALANSYRAEITAKTMLIEELASTNVEQGDAGRMRLQQLREDVERAAAKLRQLEQQRREDALEDAAQAMAATALAQGRGATVASTRSRRSDEIPDLPPNVRDVSMLFIISLAAAVILTPLVRTVGRILERRVPQQQLSPQLAAQLTRMEQAIETVAIEVERVSEGQRFATKLLSERANPEVMR